MNPKDVIMNIYNINDVVGENKTEKLVFGEVRNFTIPVQYNEQAEDFYEKSETESSVSDIENADKAETKVRKMRLIGEIQKNIANSNMNIINPENFYKKWLFDIHTRKLEKTQKELIHNENEKVIKRLDYYESLLSKKNVT